MGFANRKYARVWEIQPHEKYNEIRISTSKKNKEDNTYEQDFNGWVRCLGNAFEKSKQLKSNDTIQLSDVETTTKYDEEKKRSYTNFIVWDFEPKQNGTPPNNPTQIPLQPVDEDDLPF